ncbi:MAG: holo-ACP synthase [Bacilli bacterium]|jgi:phosphopantetheine--protein transferase-like protein|nr:holo-ACP synthase [Bacilli bacterium]
MISNGVDIISIKRINKIISNPKLLRNIFTENELEYITSRNYNTETIAGIFAAKEATLKSLHQGLDAYPLTEIEIAHQNYAPYLIFHGKLKKEIENQNLNFSVSISHDQEYAIAFVISY